MGALLAVLLALWGVFGLATPAQAQEGCTGVACVTSGSEVAELDSTQSALLNALLNSLLGDESAVNLSAGDYNALLGADVQLGALLTQLQADLGVATPSEVLDANITLGQLLSAMAAVTNDPTGEAILNNLGLTVDSLTGTIRLGDLLQIETGPGTVSDIDLNVFDLVVGSIQLFNSEHAVATATPVTIGASVLNLANVGDITLRATVVEAPVIVCGPAGSEFNSAALRVALGVNLVDISTSDSIGLGTLLNLVNVSVEATISHVDLYLDIGRGQGVIDSIDAVTRAVNVEATPGVVNLYLGSIDDAIFFNPQTTITPEDVDYGVIGTVGLSALGFTPSLVNIQARAVATGSGSAELLQFTEPYPQTLSTSAGAGALNTLLTSLINNLELRVQLTGGFELLDGLLTFVLSLISGLVNNLLSPALNTLLTNVVDPVLDALGLSVGKMTVTVLGAESLCPSLTVTKSHVGSAFLAGGTGSYNITVRNDGDAPTTGPITVVDNLPAELAYVSHSGAGWTLQNQSGQQLTFTHPGPLAPGASLPVLNLVVAVDAGAGNTTIVNTVTANTPGNQGGDDSSDTDEVEIIGDDPATACENHQICPSLDVEKTHSGNFTAGEEGVYTITVRNIGPNVTTSPITVTDTLPEGMSYALHSGAGWVLVQTQGDGQILVFAHPGPLNAGATLPPLLLTVDVALTASGTLDNEVEVNTEGNIGNGDSSDTDPTIIVPPPSCPDLPDCPSLRVEKSHTGDFVAGEQGEYVIVVSNQGEGATSDPILVTDTLPAGMTLHEYNDADGWNLQQQIGRVYIFSHAGPIGPGGTLPPLVLTVNVSPNAEGTLTNQVSADTEGNVPHDGQNAEDPTNVVPPPSCPDLDECPMLTIQKSHAGNFVAGGQGTYQLTVRNEGTAPTSSAILITDTLPAGMSYVSHSGSGWVRISSQGQVQRFIHGGPVQPNATLPVLHLTVNVSAEAEGTLTNEAEVTTGGNVPSDGDSTQDSTQIVPPDSDDLCAVHNVCPSLRIEKSHQGNFVAGGQGVYTIRVTNDGGAATTGAITVIDTLPAGLTYAAHTGSGWQVQVQGQTVTVTHPGPVAAGASLPDLRLTVNISAGAEGTVINTVTVDTPDNISGEESEDQDHTVIVPPGDPETLCLEHQVCPALHLEKRAVGTFLAGHTGQYQFIVTNEGGGATFGDIVLTDTLPDGLSYQSHSGSGWSVNSQNGQTVEMSHSGQIGPGESLPVLNLIVAIEAGMEGEVVNSATVETPGGFGGADSDADAVEVSLTAVNYIPTLHREASSDTPR